VLDTLLSLEAFWVGHPQVVRRAESKPLQLAAAARIGFSIPKWLMTNDPGRALEFIQSLDGPVIAKTVRSPQIEDKTYSLAFAHVLEPSDLSLLHDLRLGPAIFQEYVEKAYEVRVTCVADELFPVAIFSQENPSARIDWRKVPYEELRHEPCEMPPEVDIRCKSFMAHFGLNFAAFDLIVDTAGEYWFLECNPNGEWAWMQEVSGHPIGRRLARLLVDHR
jgi:glutathione synthase/RimK-type ligase-like ATP-grasp enzyme